MNTRLNDLVQDEAMLWGAEAADSYHGAAAKAMDRQWIEIILPTLARHRPNLQRTLDFACGFGRNARKLKEYGATEITLIDVNPDNISYCNKHLVPAVAKYAFQNNGCDLSFLKSDTYTHVYSFDAMVHFDVELVANYLHEFKRVLEPAGTALIHHSNFTGNPGADFRKNPHWRNYMSKQLFLHLARRAGLEVIEQNVIGWGGMNEIDCISYLRKK